MDPQYKAAPGLLDDDRPGEVTAVFATLGVKDRDNDVVLPGAFQDGQPVKMMWAHDWTKWIGDGVIRVDKKEAKFVGQFWLDTIEGAEAYKKVKRAGALAEWSWGYFVPDGASHMGEHDGQQVRFLGDKPLEVPEVSPVAVGAGINTRTTAIKSADTDTDALDRAALLDLPFSEHLELVVTDVTGLVTRAQDRAGSRAKIGRRLSRATRDHLSSLRESLDALLADDDREALMEDALESTVVTPELAELALLLQRFKDQSAYYDRLLA